VLVVVQLVRNHVVQYQPGIRLNSVCCFGCNMRGEDENNDRDEDN
jgi:hypothetical protein